MYIEDKQKEVELERYVRAIYEKKNKENGFTAHAKPIDKDTQIFFFFSITKVLSWVVQGKTSTDICSGAMVMGQY